MNILSCLWVLVAGFGFSLFFNVRGIHIPVACLGGVVAWFSYLLAGQVYANDALQTFFAAVAMSAYAEGMARLFKCPATPYFVIATLPLLPGASIYYATEHAILGRTDQCLEALMHVLAIAGTIALGVFLASSVVRIFTSKRPPARIK